MAKLWYYFMLWRTLPALLYSQKMKQRKEVFEDVRRWTGNCTLFDLHKLLIDSKLFRTVFLCRLSFESKTVYRIVKMLLPPEKAFGMDAVTKEIGGGFIVFHGNSTIVFAQKIGRNFLVHQNVTIGRGKTIGGCDLPTIGDNVYVGTGAIIVGGITIGNNVKIGAGTVVVKDVPDNCTVVGNPMRIIRNG